MLRETLGPVPAAQAGFQMGDGNAQLGGDHGGGHRRVDVADDDHPVGPVLKANTFVGGHDAGRLLAVAAAAHAKVDLSGSGSPRSRNRPSDMLAS